MASLISTHTLYADGKMVPLAPLLDSALTPPTLTTRSSYAYAKGDAILISGGLYGFRIPFDATADLSSTKWLCFQYGKTQYFTYRRAETIANGGHRVLIYDTSGNWVRYNFHGSDSLTPDVGAYKLIRTSTAGTTSVDLNSTPDDSFGVIDMTNIEGVELHTLRGTASGHNNWDLYVGNFFGLDNRLINGTNCSFDTIDAIRATDSYYDYDEWIKSTTDFMGVNGTVYAPKLDFNIGDGATTTTFTEDEYYIGWYPIRNDIEGDKLPHIILGEQERKIIINQSANDTTELLNGSISGRHNDEWSFECIGDATASCLVQTSNFYRPRNVLVNHAVFDGVVFDGASNINISSASTITNCIVRNSSGSGLRLSDVAGDYNGLTATLSNNTIDLSINPTESGAYSFTGLSIPDGYTLKVHNESAIYDISVSLNVALSSSTTAGGNVSIISGANLTISVNQAGCDVVILEAGTDTVLASVDAQVGTDFNYAYTVAQPIDIGVIKQGYVVSYTYGYSLSGVDATLPITLLIDRNYQ